MKKRSWLLVLLLFSASAHAQLYRWVGPDGNVTYSDTPPPPAARQVETKDLAPDTAGPSTAGLPYALAQAVKASPVTLYTTTQCAPCDDARTMLNTRGIPYAEKTVHTNQDIEKLKHVSGAQQLPVLAVGAKTQKGFDSNTWDTLLTAAGYPQSSQLPPDYHNPPPQPAAPAPPPQPAAPAPAPAAGRTDSGIPDTPPPAGNAPPGFRF